MMHAYRYITKDETYIHDPVTGVVMFEEYNPPIEHDTRKWGDDLGVVYGRELMDWAHAEHLASCLETLHLHNPFRNLN